MNNKNYFLKIMILAVIGLGVFILVKSFGLSASNASTDKESVAKDVQVIQMVENGSGYTPNNFVIKKDVPVRLEIDAQQPYSCASTIVIPQLGIRKQLEAGKNIIEFTPAEVGTIKFSCSMNMYRGSFSVI